MKKKKVIDQDLSNKLFNKTLFFLKFRARSCNEIRNYLAAYFRKHVCDLNDQPKITEEIITRLKNLKYIDDYDFVRQWVESRYLSKPKGKKVLIFELKQKGIAQEIIDQVIEKESQKYSSKELIKKILMKADQRYYHLPFIARKQKLLTYALRKGFDFSEISVVVDEMLKKGVE